MAGSVLLAPRSPHNTPVRHSHSHSHARTAQNMQRRPWWYPAGRLVCCCCYGSASRATSELHPSSDNLLAQDGEPAAGDPAEAQHWEAFYSQHANRFFKHRYYLRKDWGELMPPAVRANPLAHIPPLEPDKAPPPGENSKRVLELGSGVGNAAFPLVRANPNLVVTCVDCSRSALDVIESSPEYDPRRMQTLHRDASCDPICDEPATYDYVSMVYFLSALDEDGRKHAIAEAYRALKPDGGTVLFRDYAEGDMVQLRMAAKNERRAGGATVDNKADSTAGLAVDASGKFFRRGDNTLSYFFGCDELAAAMEAGGFRTAHLEVHERENVNRKHGTVMKRKFVQGRFVK